MIDHNERVKLFIKLVHNQRVFDKQQYLLFMRTSTLTED